MMRARESDRTRLRLRRRGEQDSADVGRRRLLAAVGLLLLLAPAAQAAPADAAARAASAVDTTGAQWLRGLLLSEPDLPGFGISGGGEVPTDDIVSGSGYYYELIRRATLVSAYRRYFLAFDGTSEVHIQVVELQNHVLAVVRPRADEMRMTDLPGQDAVARATTNPDGSAQFYARMSKGRVQLELFAAVDYEPDVANSVTAAAAKDLAMSTAKAQFARLSGTGDIDGATTISLQTLRVALCAALVFTAVVIQLAVWVIASLRDRGTREALLRRLRRPNRIPPDHRGATVLDVSVVARTRRRRSWAHTLGRSATMIAVFVVSYFLVSDPKGQIALLGVGVLVVSTAQVALASRRERQDIRAVHGVRAALATVVGSTFAVMAAAAAALLFLIYVASRFAMPDDMKEQGGDRLSLIYLLGALLFLVLADLTYRLGRRLAARQASRLRDKVDNDRSTRTVLRHGRREVLLLRSFSDDGITLKTRRSGRRSLLERLALRRRERFEELIAWSLWRTGPVVAIGEPGTRLPPLGAAREYYDDNDWLVAVRKKLRAAAMVVFVVGRSPNLLVEVAEARQAGALARTMFVFPPLPRKEVRSRIRVLCSALELDPTCVPSINGRNHELLSLGLDRDGRVVVTLADGRDDAAYEAALDAGTARALANSDAAVSSPDRLVAAASEPVESLLRTSPSRKEVRAAAWRRRRTLGPWVAWLALSSLGSLLAFQPPPPVPMPGRVVVGMPTGPFALTENGDIWVVDANDDLIRRDSGGVRVMQHLAHPVKRIESDGDLLLLLTTGTHGVVALHSRGSAVEEAWQVTLPSLGGDILHTAGRVLVSLPNEDRVLVLDATTGASMGSIAVPAGPWSLARRDNIVLLGSLTEPSVSELNPTTMVVQSVTRIDVSPQELLVGDGVVLTASIGDEAISAYSEPDLRLLRRIELPQSNSQVAVIGTTLLAATYGRRPELVAVDTRDLTVRWRVAVPSEAYQIAGHGNAFYADMTEDGALVRLPV